MDGSATILFISSMIIMLLALFSVSYKTGFVFFSIWSATRPNQPKFEVDKNKISKFVTAVIAAFLLNVVFGLIVLQDVNEMEGILILSLFNTAFIAYALAFGLLLREKKRK